MVLQKLPMAAYTFDDMRDHIGHEIECVRYGQGDECLNVSVECVTCGIVLFDLHKEEHYEKFLPEEK